ncbi:MAG TPA: hypothetical protein VIL38_00150 [Thermaerobacter sp.]
MAGYGRQPAGGPWVPAQATITHPGPGTFRGTVEIVGVTPVRPGITGSPAVTPPGQAGSSMMDVARWRYPVEVPAGASRTLVLPVPVASRQGQLISLEARLLDEDGRAVAWARIPIGTGRPTDVLVGVLATRDIPYLAAVPAPRGELVIPERIDPHLAPRTAAGWANFDLVVIDGAAALRQLDGDQRDALRLWVKLGGTLLLGTGPDASHLAAALGPDLFPWEVTGSVPVRQFDGALTWARLVAPDVPPVGTGGNAPDGGPSPGGRPAPDGGNSPGGGNAAGDGGSSAAPATIAAILRPLPMDGAASGDGGSQGQDRVSSPAAGRLTLAPGPNGAIPVGYIAHVGLGRVYAWSTRLDAEPWLSWAGTPAALAGWLGTDLVAGVTRRADAVVMHLGSGFRAPSGPNRSGPVFMSTPLDSGGPRSLFQPLLTGLYTPNSYWPGLDALQNAARDLPGLQFPSPGMLMAGTAAYLLLIGPVTFGWLGRRKRRPWAWVVVPVLAVLVIAGSYASGALAARGTPRAAAGFLLLDEAGRQGVWSGLVAAYRPGRPASVTLRAGSQVSPMMRPDTWAGPFQRPVEDPIMVAEPSARGLEVTWPAAGAGHVIPVAVQLDLAVAGSGAEGLTARWAPAGPDRWRIRVTNGLDVPLTGVTLFLGGNRLHQFGNLAPGEQGEAVVRVAHQAALGPSFTGFGIFGTGGGGPAAGYPGTVGGDDGAWEARQRARLQGSVSYLLQGVSGGPFLVAEIKGSPVLVDAAGGGPDGPVVPPSRWDPHGYTLVLAPVQAPGLDQGAAAGVPPAGFVPATVSNALWPAAAGMIRASAVDMPGPDVMVLRDAQVVVEWRPPEAVVPGARRLVIRLDARQPAPSPPALGAAIELYDFASGRWVPVKDPSAWTVAGAAPDWVAAGVSVQPQRLQVEGEALRRFLPPGGRLLVRFRSPEDGEMTLTLPQFVLEVSP